MSVSIQTPNPPQLGGEIKVVNGIYKQYGQNLKADGTVLFVGPVNQSRLNIDAVREIDDEDRVAGLRIQGTVETPEITVFTNPADKSEDSILSYIVLGRDINDTTDQEANLLATAALALTVKGGKNITSGLAESLGVQEFDLETRGRGDNTEIVVSGRLNDRLLLRYGRSVFLVRLIFFIRFLFDQDVNIYSSRIEISMPCIRFAMSIAPSCVMCSPSADTNNPSAVNSLHFSRLPPHIASMMG